MQTSQLELWRSQFGREYTDRNDHEKPERVAAWQRLLDGIAPARALEVGCNVGWNLEYLRRLGISELYGIEPQPYAVERARLRGPGFGVPELYGIEPQPRAVERARWRRPQYNELHGTAFDLPFRDGWFDLAFTSGVLIHIAPETIGSALDEIYRVSRRWIAAIEYDHPTEQEIMYRGHAGALWKRDFGGFYQQLFPELTLVKQGFLPRGEGSWDDVTWWLFEKP